MNKKPMQITIFPIIQEAVEKIAQENRAQGKEPSNKSSVIGRILFNSPEIQAKIKKAVKTEGRNGSQNRKAKNEKKKG